MRAWRGPDATPTQAPDPLPDAGDVVLDVEAVAFAGPELAALDRNVVTPGGACVGVVVDAGAEARDALGVRAVVGPVAPCGECDVCLRGAAAVCPARVVLGVDVDGALADKVRAPARWICRLDGGLDVPGPGAALLGREAALAYALYARCGVAPGEPVVVIGAETIGSLLADVAFAKGTRPIVVSLTPTGATAARVIERGGHAMSAEPSPEAVRAAVAGAAAAVGAGRKPLRVFDTTGLDRGRALALALAGPGARVALLAPSAAGLPDATPAAIGELLGGDGELLAVSAAHPDLLPELAALATRGELDLAAAAAVYGAEALADALSHVRGQTGRCAVVALRGRGPGSTSR